MAVCPKVYAVAGISGPGLDKQLDPRHQHILYIRRAEQGISLDEGV